VRLDFLTFGRLRAAGCHRSRRLPWISRRRAAGLAFAHLLTIVSLPSCMGKETLAWSGVGMGIPRTQPICTEPRFMGRCLKAASGKTITGAWGPPGDQQPEAPPSG
jgi:hypothetical protein